MSLLKDFSPMLTLPEEKLTQSEVFSVYYHGIFNYPLTFQELVKWTAFNPPKIKAEISFKNGFYFIKGRDGLVYKRLVAERKSVQKREITERAAKILKIIPTIKMIGITGSLAMNNAGEKGDIDLFFIVQKGKLWTTRILTYALLKLSGFSLRTPGDKAQKDKLCLNMWMDESDLIWPKNDRNFYTAHEILQINPLIDRGGVFETFIRKNKWVFDFWPGAIKLGKTINNNTYSKLYKLNLIDLFAYKLQRGYMSPKKTREIITYTRAIFHPVKLSNSVLGKFGLDKGSKTS